MVSISHFIHGGIKSAIYNGSQKYVPIGYKYINILAVFERIETDIAVKGIYRRLRKKFICKACES